MRRLGGQYGRRAMFCVWGLLALGVSTAKAGTPDFDIEIGLKSYFTSNLYHVAEERADQFDSKDGPGERFHDMAGPEDFVARPAFDLTWQWDIGKKRDLEISFGADYYLHAHNAIANYLELDGAMAYDLTRRDKLGLAAEFIPDRFRKNLSLEDPDTGLKVFDRADYRQIKLAPRYIHDWNKDWTTGVEYEFSQRDYEVPFDNRDRDRHTVTALVAYDGLKRTDIAVGVGFSSTETPIDTEFGVKVDRSYDDLFVKFGVEFDLRHHWEAKLGTKYRVREYTTNERADTARYGRTDDLWMVDAEVGKWLQEDFYVGVLAGWARNDSDREDDTIESDEVGYEEYIVGLVAEWRF